LRELMEAVARALEVTRRIAIPEAEAARSAAFLITMIEGGTLHADRLRQRPQDFDPAVAERLLAGMMLPGAWGDKAQRFRRRFRDAVLKLFDEVDVILVPASPFRAPKLGQKTALLGGMEMPVRANLGLFTQPFSFIGLPIAVAPIWSEGKGLPLGVQAIAAPWREDFALRVARQLEKTGIARAPVARGFADD
jgi:aspartyl-tRNA(Asn)/glutamyl-tRNA(Gln) amidotransferase subunit A